jgi:hypothetical protein
MNKVRALLITGVAGIGLFTHSTYAQTQMLNYSSGTGFFISSNGYVLTNNHVIDGCVDIKLYGAVSEQEAVLVARDEKHDLALLKAQVSAPNFANLSNQKQPLRQGDPVIIVGYPGQAWKTGQTTTSQAQIVNTKGPVGKEHWLEFSDALAQGNSGGPLLDASANVVGVVVAKVRSYIYNEQEQTEEAEEHFDAAISLPVVRGFLDANNISYVEADSGIYLSAGHATEIARRFVVNVRCRYDERAAERYNIQNANTQIQEDVR